MPDLSNSNYWTKTEDYLKQTQGYGPKCPRCGEEMFPADDHGRFTCFCSLGQHLDVSGGNSIGSFILSSLKRR